MVNKNQAIIEFLKTCPSIQNSPLYFNFGEAKDDAKQIVTTGNDKMLSNYYIDGSVLKRFTFTLIDYKSIASLAVPNIAGYIGENVEDIMDVQAIIDWITEQADLRNYPDFGANCQIDEMEAMSDNPDLNGVDNSVSPNLAKYSFSIQITYLDTSKCVWKG